MHPGYANVADGIWQSEADKTFHYIRPDNSFSLPFTTLEDAQSRLGETPLLEGVLGLSVGIRIDDATESDQRVNLDQISTAITLALKPLFSQLPCVSVNLDAQPTVVGSDGKSYPIDDPNIPG